MTTAQIRRKMESLEECLTQVCGFPVEITVRGRSVNGGMAFTLSADGEHDFTSALKFLRSGSRLDNVESGYDRGCDLSFCYFDIG